MEDSLGLVDVRVVLGADPPGQRCHPLQVCPADVKLGRLRLQGSQAADLLVHGLRRLLADADEIGDRLLERGDDGLLVVAFQVQLPTDVAQLLHEHVASVLLGELVLDLALHLRLQACVLDLLLQDHQHLPEARLGDLLDEHGLQLVPRRRRHPRDQVRQLQGVVEVVVPDDLVEVVLVRELRFEQVLHRRDDLVVQRTDLGAVRGGDDVRHSLHEH
mmetsp:Transcript_89208/g.257194  ORF Transcript_89208/g.257194 Transcript_89208/m.257194 type:complete len:217 (-) Transcript_89208:275-925(-)